MDLIDKHIIKRSKRAIKCLYLNSNFYSEVKINGLSAGMVFEQKGKYISDILNKIVTKDDVEECFLWLIKIGILRREVDGQGLTSKVRITPLGRIILNDHPNLPNEKASKFELTFNWILRRLILK